MFGRRVKEMHKDLIHVLLTLCHYKERTRGLFSPMIEFLAYKYARTTYLRHLPRTLQCFLWHTMRALKRAQGY